MKRRILGLDPSLSSYGWALYNPLIETKLEGCGVFKTKSRDLFVLRNMMMRDSLKSLIDLYNPDCVAIEYPIFKETYSEGMYGLFLFSCEALYTTNKNVVFFDNSQVKAFAKRMISRPSGWVMNKPDMKEAAELHSGVKNWKTSDEADAFIISILGSRFWGYIDGDITIDGLTDYEKKLFLEIKKPVKGKNAGLEINRGIALRENDRFFMWGNEDVGQKNGSKSGNRCSKIIKKNRT